MLDIHSQKPVKAGGRRREELLGRESGVCEEAAEALVVSFGAGWSKCEILQWQARHMETHPAIRPGGQASERSRLGASAGLTAEGTHPGRRERPLESSRAEILRRTSSREGLELRPFHREKKATVESSRRYTRRLSEEG